MTQISKSSRQLRYASVLASAFALLVILLLVSGPSAAGEDANGSVAEADETIRSLIEPIHEEIVEVASKLADIDPPDFSKVGELMAERREICREHLIEPEAEHTPYVRDVCSSVLRELLRET